MATIYKELTVQATPEDVWAAIRDVGAVHTRVARQFVTDTRLDGDSRLVTFANGAVIRERIITIDDERRRLAYSVVEWQTTHHNATFQVIADGDRRTRIVWIADLLPDNLATFVSEQMSQGVEAITRTMEADRDHG
jgi:carbon monoxide dehydrogenase subunit G